MNFADNGEEREIAQVAVQSTNAQPQAGAGGGLRPAASTTAPRPRTF